MGAIALIATSVAATVTVLAAETFILIREAEVTPAADRGGLFVFATFLAGAHIVPAIGLVVGGALAFGGNRIGPLVVWPSAGVDFLVRCCCSGLSGAAFTTFLQPLYGSDLPFAPEVLLAIALLDGLGGLASLGAAGLLALPASRQSFT